MPTITLFLQIYAKPNIVDGASRNIPNSTLGNCRQPAVSTNCLAEWCKCRKQDFSKTKKKAKKKISV